MLKRLRTAHPILYCILSEVLFLGSMVLFSLLATIGLAAAGADFDTMDGYLLATKYAKDDLVPMMIQVTDESLTRITVSWLTGTVDGETFSDWLMGADAADVDAEVHTQEISLDSRDEEGRMFMSFPFAYKESVFVDDETGEVYDYSAWSQVVRVEAYDAAGHRTLRNALLYTARRCTTKTASTMPGIPTAPYGATFWTWIPCGATSWAACPIPASSSPMICWMKTAASM